MPAVAWYDVIQSTEQLQQGDMIRRCPCPIVTFPAGDRPRLAKGITFDFKELTTVVLSQSCDLEQDNIEEVLLSYAYPVTEAGKPKDWPEEVRKGRHPALYFLPPVDYPGLEQEAHIIDFRKLYVVAIPLVGDAALVMDRRLRMRSPFREALSRHFDNYFGRVALPV
jgi:hypothetical protein